MSSTLSPAHCACAMDQPRVEHPHPPRSTGRIPPPSTLGPSLPNLPAVEAPGFGAPQKQSLPNLPAVGAPRAPLVGPLPDLPTFDSKLGRKLGCGGASEAPPHLPAGPWPDLPTFEASPHLRAGSWPGLPDLSCSGDYTLDELLTHFDPQAAPPAKIPPKPWSPSALGPSLWKGQALWAAEEEDAQCTLDEFLLQLTGHKSPTPWGRSTNTTPGSKTTNTIDPAALPAPGHSLRVLSPSPWGRSTPETKTITTIDPAGCPLGPQLLHSCAPNTRAELLHSCAPTGSTAPLVSVTPGHNLRVLSPESCNTKPRSPPAGDPHSLPSLPPSHCAGKSLRSRLTAAKGPRTDPPVLLADFPPGLTGAKNAGITPPQLGSGFLSGLIGGKGPRPSAGSTEGANCRPSCKTNIVSEAAKFSRLSSGETCWPHGFSQTPSNKESQRVLSEAVVQSAGDESPSLPEAPMYSTRRSPESKLISAKSANKSASLLEAPMHSTRRSPESKLISAKSANKSPLLLEVPVQWRRNNPEVKSSPEPRSISATSANIIRSGGNSSEPEMFARLPGYESTRNGANIISTVDNSGEPEMLSRLPPADANSPSGVPQVWMKSQSSCPQTGCFEGLQKRLSAGNSSVALDPSQSLSTDQAVFETPQRAFLRRPKNSVAPGPSRSPSTGQPEVHHPWPGSVRRGSAFGIPAGVSTLQGFPSMGGVSSATAARALDDLGIPLFSSSRCTQAPARNSRPGGGQSESLERISLLATPPPPSRLGTLQSNNLGGWGGATKPDGSGYWMGWPVLRPDLGGLEPSGILPPAQHFTVFEAPQKQPAQHFTHWQSAERVQPSSTLDSLYAEESIHSSHRHALLGAKRRAHTALLDSAKELSPTADSPQQPSTAARQAGWQYSQLKELFPMAVTLPSSNARKMDLLPGSYCPIAHNSVKEFAGDDSRKRSRRDSTRRSGNNGDCAMHLTKRELQAETRGEETLLLAGMVPLSVSLLAAFKKPRTAR